MMGYHSFIFNKEKLDDYYKDVIIIYIYIYIYINIFIINITLYFNILIHYIWYI